MDIKQYIASGILELYVYGALSEKESMEVSQVLQQHPEVRAKVEAIEGSLTQLATAAAPYQPDQVYQQIKTKLKFNDKDIAVIPITRKSTNLPAYLGWAASIALLIGLFIQFDKNKELRQEVVQSQIDKNFLEGKIQVAEEDLTKTKTIISVLRNKDVIEVPLQAQQVAPDAYAAVYWDKKNQTAYIDVAGLPTPPPSKVYQVWSLKLDPLTPTSLGTLDSFNEDTNKVFALSNANESEAFGITLEPEGGS